MLNKVFNMKAEDKNEFEEKLQHIDKTASKLLNIDGVQYYLKEENRVEQANLQELQQLGASKEVAQALVKSMKFLRSKALYNNFGMGSISEARLQLAYKNVEELIVQETEKHFQKKGIKVDMFGRRFGASDRLSLEDRHLIGVVNFVVLLNWQIQYADHSGEKMDSFEIARNTKVEAIVADLEDKSAKVQ